MRPSSIEHHRRRAPLGQGHRILPTATRIHLGAQHQQGVAGGVEPGGHGGESLGGGPGMTGYRPG